jgi:hypothetical protein
MNVLASSTGIGFTWRALDPAPHLIRRFLVLLPNADINEAQLAHAVWTLAGEHHASVHVIALIDDWADEAQVQLRVALLSALLRGSGIEPEEHYEKDTTDWLGIVRRIYAPGDVVVCHAEQTLPLNNGRFPPHFSPLSTHIAMLHMPVCELRGAIKQTPAMTVRRAIKVWGLPLAVIFGSLALEILFMRWARDWVEWSRQAVLAAYTAAEILTVVWLSKG